VIIIAGLVSGALLASGAIEIYFSYHENREALVALQREKAIGVAALIDAFIKEIERQISWTTQPQLGAPAAALYQRRLDYIRLLRQALPIGPEALLCFAQLGLEAKHRFLRTDLQQAQREHRGANDHREQNDRKPRVAGKLG
jgi:hypothetical protein